jgi:hypothetical protein
MYVLIEFRVSRGYVQSIPTIDDLFILVSFRWIIQLYHGENKLIYNEMIMKSSLY